MSSCLSSGGGGGGGRAYRLEALDLEIIKSPSSTSWISNSSSPSSTLSESSNCAPLAISTRKPRTPRKRPNQTYNEAAAILSTAYPKIFPTKPSKLASAHDRSYNYSSTFLFEPSELLMPLQGVDALLDSRLLLEKPEFPIGIKGLNLFEKPCRSPPEIDSNSSECHDEFDAESILDEEIGGGIESIMGNIEVENGALREPPPSTNNNTFCYGYPVGLGLGLGLGLGFGMRRESREMRNDHCDWWRFPCVNVVDVNPNIGSGKDSKKKKKVEIKKAEAPAPAGSESSVSAAEDAAAPQGLNLKLNFDGVLNAWSDKASPFSGDSPPSDAAGSDLRARLAQIDLFSDNGGLREASVLRYKEKRRTRLFSKKIRYQVRKVNADRRPRMKGRFVRTPTSSDD